jgi:enamine deaminase RidA (YjgF/YER057c/UK114 family)
MKRKLISNATPLEKKIGFSRAVRVGPNISVGGTAPIDKTGKTVGIGDPAAQTRQCFEIIKDALERAGSGLRDVVRSRILLTRIEDWEAVIKVRAEYLSDVKPVDTIMQISRFVNPEWLVEIEVDAIVNE